MTEAESLTDPNNNPAGQATSLKIKLNLSTAAAPTAKPKKENPEDDENNLLIEEHLIIRLPSNDPMTKEIKEIIKTREDFPSDFSITWKDRRGLLKYKNQEFFCKLVDLPCILESQKTLDRKRFYKIADISQMIVVERCENAQEMLQKPLRTADTVSNSGVAPPLKYCRLRRFRKRVNRKRVESIETEVIRLLRADKEAVEVVEQELEPHELEKRLAEEEERMARDDGEEGLEAEDISVQVEDKDGEESDDASVDSELAAELEDEIARAVDEGEESDAESEDQEEQEEQEEIDEELDEQTQALVEKQKLLREEMKDLEEKIKEKTDQRDKSVNVLMQKRFDDIIGRLENEKELKESQLMEIEMNIEEAKQEAEGLQEKTTEVE